MDNFSFKSPSKQTLQDRNTINIVPCSVDFQGKARVDDYFNVKTQKNEENQELRNNFRGRTFVGREINLENTGNLTGVIYEKKHTNKCSFEYIPVETFKKLRYWQYEEEQGNKCEKFDEILAFMEISELVNKETN